MFLGTACNVAGAHLLRIATGGEMGTYFPVATLIARGLSGSTGACPREEEMPSEASCGIPGLVSVAQLSNGSVTNVTALASRAVEAALVQADVAYWAHSGTGRFADTGRVSNLRAVASLYPESVHIVARKGAGLKSVADLKGRRVALDEPGSGTLEGARTILKAYDLDESDIQPVYLKPKFAARLLARKELDAFFIISGYPASSVADVLAGDAAKLLPLEEQGARRAVAENAFFSRDRIPAGVYPGTGDTPTLRVYCLLLVTEEMDAQLAYEVTRTLWSSRTLNLVRSGHPKGAEMMPERALLGISVPLHAGAQRYYREQGYLVDETKPAPAGQQGDG